MNMYKKITGFLTISALYFIIVELLIIITKADFKDLYVFIPLSIFVAIFGEYIRKIKRDLIDIRKVKIEEFKTIIENISKDNTKS